MTAETLKPFITPTTDNFPMASESNSSAAENSSKYRQRSCNYFAIGLSAGLVVLVTVLVGFTIFNGLKICQLETQLSNLTRVVENMHNRLGINYLDEYKEFEKQYSNSLIDNPDKLDDVTEDEDDDDYDSYDDTNDDTDSYNDENEGNDDDDEDDDDDDKFKNSKEYEDYMQELIAPNSDESNSNSSDEADDNIMDDLGKYKDSKKKRQNARKTRSIGQATLEMPTPKSSLYDKPVSSMDHTDNLIKHREMHRHSRHHHSSYDSLGEHGHKRHIVGDHLEKSQLERSPLRPRSHRRRRPPVLKNGESIISAKSTMGPFHTMSFTPAAHFHLNRKVPNGQSAFRVDSFPGDLYMGHPSYSHDSGMEHFFHLNNGVLTVREPGLYYIYAQVCYNNSHDQNGFVIFHGHLPFLQCLNTIPTNMPSKIHTCHTSGLIQLGANETIHLRDFHSDRNAVLKDANNRSYFGLIKI